MNRNRQLWIRPTIGFSTYTFSEALMVIYK